METAFAGTYFDGKSSRPHAAQVWLEPGQLRIDYQKPNQPVPVRVYWQPKRIRKEIFADRHITLLHYGDYPSQTLEITSPEFNQVLEAQYRQEPLAKPQELVPVSRVPPWFWMAAIVLLLGTVGFYFWGLPFLADKVAGAMPQSTDEYLGKQLYTQVIGATKENKQLSPLVRGFYRQLQVNSTYNMHVAVINDETPNAFALPGGYLLVHNSILKRLQQPEELAALLGHETGHVQLRHTTRALFRSLSSYLFISLIFGDIAGITAVIMQNADVLKRLEYSRRLEREADEFSFGVLQRSRVNPQGLVLLFTHLKEEQGAENSNGTQEFLSTHPALDARIMAMKSMIKKNPYAVQPPDSLQYYWDKIKAGQ